MAPPPRRHQATSSLMSRKAVYKNGRRLNHMLRLSSTRIMLSFRRMRSQPRTNLENATDKYICVGPVWSFTICWRRCGSLCSTRFGGPRNLLGSVVVWRSLRTRALVPKSGVTVSPLRFPFSAVQRCHKHSFVRAFVHVLNPPNEHAKAIR